MTSTKVKIDNVSKNERTFSSPTDKAVTKMRDKVITSIEITKRSGVPTLFFSNPGYGKTTTINSYARMSGMHVEELIVHSTHKMKFLDFSQERTNHIWKFLSQNGIIESLLMQNPIMKKSVPEVCSLW